jgi:hypothetical protein
LELIKIDGETYDSLFDRISKKAGLQTAQAKALKSGQEGGLVYEYKGEKYSLEDGTLGSHVGARASS